MRIECDRYFDPPTSKRFIFETRLIAESADEEEFVFPQPDPNLVAAIDKESQVVLEDEGRTLKIIRCHYDGDLIDKLHTALMMDVLFRGIRRRKSEGES